MLKQSGRDLPFIVVTGAINDETAVKAMRSGAHDYVLKDKQVTFIRKSAESLSELVNDLLDLARCWSLND